MRVTADDDIQFGHGHREHGIGVYPHVGDGDEGIAVLFQVFVPGSSLSVVVESDSGEMIGIGVGKPVRGLRQPDEA